MTDPLFSSPGAKRFGVVLATLLVVFLAAGLLAVSAPSAEASAYGQETPGASVTASQTVNLRAGPGTGYSRVGQLSAKQTLPILGKNQDGSWWQVQLSNGNKAWIAGWLVKASGAVDQVAVAQDIPKAPAPSAARASAFAPGFFGYGIQIHPDANRGAAIDAVKGMGFNWVKFQLPWKDFEGSPGQRNWPDDKVDDLNRAGLSTLVSIVKAPELGPQS